MKKLNLLIIAALLATMLLMAATPTKLVRLTVNNDSGDTVYIKLEGDLTESFYYLTIPDGETEAFTVYSDVYKRTTWACDGVKTSGRLIMTGNVRLRFTECNTIPTKLAIKADGYTWLADAPDAGDPGWFGWAPLDDGNCDNNCTYYKLEAVVTCEGCVAYRMVYGDVYRTVSQGEPTMEKVSYFKYYDGVYYTIGLGQTSYWVIVKRTFKIPQGIFFRYRY